MLFQGSRKQPLCSGDEEEEERADNYERKTHTQKNSPPRASSAMCVVALASSSLKAMLEMQRERKYIEMTKDRNEKTARKEI